jgi:hypothetical protein
VKKIEWSGEKDEWLIKNRSISFSNIANKILAGEVIGIKDNPRYKNQRFFILEINNYIYCVPFVEDEFKFFLKTAYANRKLNKKLNKNTK